MSYLPVLTVPFDHWMEKSGHLQVTAPESLRETSGPQIAV